jgi:uncharacterized protein YceH (UPF0502 family)
MQLDRTERRILGSLIEKRWSTPDQYPLTMNALVTACRQKSNRDPVLNLEEFEITGCLLALREKGLVIIREREGGHVPRYAERLAEELSLGPTASAILAELMLRGPQTAPELSRRVPRMVRIEGLSEIERELADLARTRLVRLQAKVSGQRHARWAHLLSTGEPLEEPEETAEPALPSISAPPPSPAREPPVPEPPAPEPAAPESTEVERLREEIAELRARVKRLEERLAAEPGGGPHFVG